MKVLFVCYANVGRSQVAQEYFNMITGEESLSAGYGVNYLGLKKVKDSQYKRSIKFIQDTLGIDISEKETIQFTQKLMTDSDLTIFILEDNQMPPMPYKLNGNWRQWMIKDTPGQDLESTYNTWHEVILRVDELVKVIHFKVREKTELDDENLRLIED